MSCIKFLMFEMKLKRKKEFRCLDNCIYFNFLFDYVVYNIKMLNYIIWNFNNGY